MEDTIKGVSKKIALGKMVKCQRCDGTGGEPNTKIKECISCRGTGQVQQMKKTILGTITRTVVCPECNGDGKIPEKPCNVCSGEGRIEDRQDLEVFIPAGVDTGQTIKVEGAGDAGRRGSNPGNLYLRIFVKQHPVFVRRGDDVFVSTTIPFSRAALGGEVEVPTLEKKKIILKIPERTQSGKILKIGGKGIPHFSSWGRGDMFVEFVVETPKKLNKKQKEILKNLQKEGL